MNIVILGILHEKTGLDLPPDLFVDHPSLEAVQTFRPACPIGQTALCGEEQTQQQQQRSRGPTQSPTPCRLNTHAGKTEDNHQNPLPLPRRLRLRNLLRAHPRGRSSSGNLRAQQSLMTNPSAFTNGIPGITAMYLSEVRRRQPHGPYLLGGWSPGGVIAYEIVQQLLSAGERVDKLILFDSPCPIKLEPLPHHLHHFFAEVGLLGSEGQDPPT